MLKCVFDHMRAVNDRSECASAQSSLGLRSTLTQPLDIKECINGETNAWMRLRMHKLNLHLCTLRMLEDTFSLFRLALPIIAQLEGCVLEIKL